MSWYENENVLPEQARIHNVAIPLVMISALDDPLCSWRVVASNTGLMHPEILPSQVRSGNLVLLLTKAGGHVGWPLGWAPQGRKWEWMNNAASTFAEAVLQAKGELSQVTVKRKPEEDISESVDKNTEEVKSTKMGSSDEEL